MKNLKLLMLLIFCSLFALYSCSGDDEGDNPKEKVSKLTPEQHKEKLQDEAIAFIDDMEAIQKSDAIEVLVSFADCIVEEDEDYYDYSNGAYSVVKPVLGLKEDPQNALELKSALMEDENESLSRLYNDEKGVFTYNSDAEEWDFEETGDDIVFLFPSSEESTTNDAELRISNFSYETASQQDIEDFTLELVKSLKVELKKDGASLMSFTFSGDYYDDSTPKLMSEKFVIGDYVIENKEDLTNKSKVNVSCSMKKGSKTIWSATTEADGNFDYDNVESIIEEDEERFEEIVSSIKASIEIENIKVEGSFQNIAQVVDSVEILNEIEDDEEYYNQFVELLNNNMLLKIKYDNENEVIATGEFYTCSEYCEYSQEDQYDGEFRMKFNDGSYLDDSYFDNGFTKLINRMNLLIDKVNETHDVEIEHIEE